MEKKSVVDHYEKLGVKHSDAYESSAAKRIHFDMY